jgi:hypothetical protein
LGALLAALMNSLRWLHCFHGTSRQYLAACLNDLPHVTSI